jgi:hypothetical protein
VRGKRNSPNTPLSLLDQTLKRKNEFATAGYVWISFMFYKVEEQGEKVKRKLEM